ncbi:chorismate mutase [Streptomyces sp. WMMB303]|uniref:chorismate mutase n=1 Tax=Streptomyces sp. WMMB303 TaxID=3034154 RepID=UPI0023ED007D|nr:chorismate mutase [Streptomyces sp. WMMB303]MDF4253911.1 chorismate mutase [Streptomyces sp. WMMB303]
MSATTAGNTTSTSTSTRADQAPEAVIDAERARIDALDARIVALVRDRMEVSENIQRVRIDSGGRRVHLAREMQILDHYSTELGAPGRELARTLLRLCRGH